MKTFTKLLCALALGIAALSSAPALAHHARAHFGFYFGGPMRYPSPYHYPLPAYYYPPPVVVQSAPTYIEQPQNSAPPPSSAPQTSSDNYWYFCRESQNYYPYVKDCPTPWQRVPSRPPGS